jgi:glycosyltransferase involved in cell wall biosynthesis
MRHCVQSLRPLVLPLTYWSWAQLRTKNCGLFPSREEGFGWPILEAQACGCPVITTDRAPMTEIAGTAAILIDSDDTRDAAQCILKDQYRFPQLKEEGLRNVERFTVKKAMDEYESIYRDVIAGQSASSYSETPKHFEGSEP